MLHPTQLQPKPSEREWASSELVFKGFGDGSERVRGYRQMFGHVGTLGGTPQERGPPQVSRLATQPHLIAGSILDALAMKVHLARNEHNFYKMH